MTLDTLSRFFYTLQPMNILQVAPPNVWERIGDQAFTVVILITIAYHLWQRQKELETKNAQMEEKMTKYLEEDRSRMMEVIENNTRAFERLDHLIGSKIH